MNARHILRRAAAVLMSFVLLMVSSGAAVFADEPQDPKLAFHSLILSGQIGVIYYMDLPGDIADYEDSYMEFTVNGETQRFAFSKIEEVKSTYTQEEKTYYGFICYVNAVQMAEEITAVYHYGEKAVPQQSYSVKEYVDYAEAHKEDFTDRTLALIEAVADMGHYVQTYLADARGWTIGEKYAETEKISELTEEQIAEAKEGSRAYEAVTTAAEGNKLYCSLYLDTETAISVYLETESTGTVTAKVNGEDAEVIKSGKYYQVTTDGIPAHKLGDSYTVTFFADGAEAASVEASALSYVCTVLNADEGTFSDAAVRASASIYNYYTVAMAYRS